MPLVIHPRVRKALRRTAALTALACVAGTGVAQAACPQQSTTKPFAPFGDLADYTLTPGGGFEAGTPSWTLSGAAVVAGNQTLGTGAATDSQALSIAPNGVAVSPTFCVDPSNPYLRLFAKKLSGHVGSLRIDILYTSPINGHAMAATAGYVVQGYRNATGDYSDWAPGAILRLATTLPLDKTDNGMLPVQLRLSANSDAGAWAVDDVFVDPYRFG